MVLLHGKKARITCAGHFDARYYQCWLSAPSDGNSFIKQALAGLLKQFPGYAISFRFLPPGTPLGWMNDDKTWRQHSVVQSMPGRLFT